MEKVFENYDFINNNTGNEMIYNNNFSFLDFILLKKFNPMNDVGYIISWIKLSEFFHDFVTKNQKIVCFNLDNPKFKSINKKDFKDLNKIDFEEIYFCKSKEALYIFKKYFSHLTLNYMDNPKNYIRKIYDYLLFIINTEIYKDYIDYKKLLRNSDLKIFNKIIDDYVINSYKIIFDSFLDYEKCKDVSEKLERLLKKLIDNLNEEIMNFNNLEQIHLNTNDIEENAIKSYKLFLNYLIIDRLESFIYSVFRNKVNKFYDLNCFLKKEKDFKILTVKTPIKRKDSNIIHYTYKNKKIRTDENYFKFFFILYKENYKSYHKDNLNYFKLTLDLIHRLYTNLDDMKEFIIEGEKKNHDINFKEIDLDVFLLENQDKSKYDIKDIFIHNCEICHNHNILKIISDKKICIKCIFQKCDDLDNNNKDFTQLKSILNSINNEKYPSISNILKKIDLELVKNQIENNVKENDEIISKVCPYCNIYVEKEKGCNYITCNSMACQGKNSFCFICLQKITKSSKKDHYPEGVYENFCVGII